MSGIFLAELLTLELFVPDDRIELPLTGCRPVALPLDESGITDTSSGWLLPYSSGSQELNLLATGYEVLPLRTPTRIRTETILIKSQEH